MPTRPTAPARRLGLRLFAIAAVIALGLATRKAPGLFPAFVVTWGGDALYATLWVGLLGLVGALGRGPFRRSALHTAGAALAVCTIIELSQAVHVAWLDALRATTPGALVLGRGFLWSDLACYVVGAGLGLALELAMSGKRPAGFADIPGGA